MRKACQYAIIRFMPFIETGEFANVGIVLLCPEERFFNFKLLKRYGRITQFFESMDKRIYLEAKKIFCDELFRVQDSIKYGQLYNLKQQNNTQTIQNLFQELVRPREVIMRFDSVRVTLTDNPQAKLDELYGFYVERDFATKEYQDRLLEKQVNRILWGSNLGHRFTPQRVGNDVFNVRFPFVEKRGDNFIKVIKPFYLAQDEPSKILDHGGRWVERVRRLKRYKLLPAKVLFPVQAPALDQGRRFTAYQDICNELKEYGALITPINDVDKIIEFASI